MKDATALIPVERIEKSILLVRGERVMLDSDLAELYEVETKVLNRAVKRNLKRFPADFMFQLNSEEAASLSSNLAPQRPGAAAATGPMYSPNRRKPIGFRPRALKK